MSGKTNLSNPARLVYDGEEVRLDRLLADRFSDWSRSALQKLVKKRFILVDGHPASSSHRLKKGQVVEIRWPLADKKKPATHFKGLPFPLVFEDEWLFAVDKPPGLVVHPAHGHNDGHTLVEMVRHKVEGDLWPEDIRPGLVHRLDRDTSGIMVLAKTPEIQAKLSLQFSKRQVEKTYLALVKGLVKQKEGTLESHLARHPGERRKYAVSSRGRYAKTGFKVAEHLGEHATLMELHPLTGRTHQIRVHLSAYHHPILGDQMYGIPEAKFAFIKRQMLHAWRLVLRHPKTGRSLKLEAPPPDDFQQALKLIRLSA